MFVTPYTCSNVKYLRTTQARSPSVIKIDVEGEELEVHSNHLNVYLREFSNVENGEAGLNTFLEHRLHDRYNVPRMKICLMNSKWKTRSSTSIDTLNYDTQQAQT